MSDDESESALPLDGNAVAGLLREVFACEMTLAVVTGAEPSSGPPPRMAITQDEPSSSTYS